MAKKRIIKNYPRIDKPFQTVADVEAYLRKLVRAIEENSPNIFAGDVIVDTAAPTSADGQDGDVWVKT